MGRLPFGIRYVVRKRLELASKGRYSSRDIPEDRKVGLAMVVAGLLLTIVFAGISFSNISLIMVLVVRAILVVAALLVSWTGACVVAATAELRKRL